MTQTATVNRATSTVLAQPIARKKTKIALRASETDTVTTLIRKATKGVAQVSEVDTPQHLIISQTTVSAVKTPRMRLRAYAPDGSALGLLPVPSNPQVAYPLNDLGSLRFAYSPKAPKGSLLGQPREIAVELSANDGLTWSEPRDSRFLYMVDGRDPTDPVDQYDVDCKPYIWRLSKAVVLPNGLLNNEGKRAFLLSEGANPGVIMKTLLDEAKARGWAPGITYSSFSTTTDSAGAAWSNKLTIYYTPGLDYWTILRNLADQGFIDFHMQGRDLKIYNADAGMSVDRTITQPQITLRGGRDLTEAPFKRTWEGLANFAYFAGDKMEYTYTNPGAITPWGRQEIFLSNGSVTESSTAAILTQAELSQADAERIEHTHGLDFAQAKAFPLIDYHVGNYVWSVVTKGLPSRLRIRQLTLSTDSTGKLGGNVVLNDRFLESDIRQQRRVEGITNGASGSSSDGTGTGVTGQAEKLAPGQVTGLTATVGDFVGPGGFTQSNVVLDWNDLTTNSDGSVMFDLDHYEVYHRMVTESFQRNRFVTNTVDSGVTLSPYTVGSKWFFCVRAVDRDGHRGAMSAEIVVTMAEDTTPPQAPSVPTATALLGQLSVTWDGRPATGSWPLDFSHVEVHASTTNNFTPEALTLIDRLFSKGVVPYTAGVYGIPTYFKLVAVDTSGLKGPASTQATATPARLVGNEISTDAITYEQLAFKDPGNVVADGSFETQKGRDEIAARSHAVWSFTSSEHYHGEWAATMSAASSIGEDRDLWLTPPNDLQQEIKPGEKLFFRFAYKVSVGAAGSFNGFVRWELRDGTFTHSFLNAPTFDDVWHQAAAQMVAPVEVVRFAIGVSPVTNATAGTYRVDAVEVRRTVGTSIIEDLAVTNALIATATIQDAKIANVSAGKITSGSVTADLIIAGSFKTATSGARVEITSTGIRMYNSANVNTVEISPSVEYLRLNSTGDANTTSNTHPLQIGLDSGQNMRFDNNEILSVNNGAESTLALNLEGADVHLSGAFRTRKINDDDVHFLSDAADLAFQYRGDLSEIRVTNAVATAFRPIRASSFPTGSAAAVKILRQEFDPFEIIKLAPAEKWQYRPGYAEDGVWHYGPMADDLPDVRRGEGEEMSLDVAALNGVLWEAVRLLTNRVEVLEHAES